MNDALKYVIDEYGNIAIFSPVATHSHIARCMHGKAVGAGFVRFENGKPRCYGESISLDVVSRGSVDEDIITSELSA